MKILFSCPVALALLAVGLGACKPKNQDAPPAPAHAETPAPTNRVPIPEAVRRNLAMSFAKAEVRPVLRTLRLGGQIKAMAEDQQKVAAPMAGRVHWLVRTLDRVKAGQQVAELDSPAFYELCAEDARLKAALDALPMQSAALKAQSEAQAEVVAVWDQRLTQLEQARQAGGGSNEAVINAKAAQAAAKVALAQTGAQEAALAAEAKRVETAHEAVHGRLGVLVKQAAGEESLPAVLPIFAKLDGTVVSLGVSEGAWAEAGANLLEVLNTATLSAQALAPAGDAARLRDGLACSIEIEGQAPIAADLRLSPQAEAGNLHVVARPQAAGASLRAGFPAVLAIVVDGEAKPALAVPKAAVVSDGATPVLFRRDPKQPDQAIRMEADIGGSDGVWVVIKSGLKAGDEVVVDGAWQLMLATSGASPKGGHFHADGTFHEGNHGKGGQ